MYPSVFLSFCLFSVPRLLFTWNNHLHRQDNNILSFFPSIHLLNYLDPSGSLSFCLYIVPRLLLTWNNEHHRQDNNIPSVCLFTLEISNTIDRTVISRLFPSTHSFDILDRLSLPIYRPSFAVTFIDRTTICRLFPSLHFLYYVDPSVSFPTLVAVYAFIPFIHLSDCWLARPFLLFIYPANRTPARLSQGVADPFLSLSLSPSSSRTLNLLLVILNEFQEAGEKEEK